MISILLFIVVLSFLVIIHELGHYFVARFFKVGVEEFGVGYPPRALKLFKVGKTLFSLNWIPFGGFVKLDGEEIPKDVDLEKAAEGENVPFYAKSTLARMCIILAGISTNFIFGFIAFSIFFSIKGIPTVMMPPRVVEVVAGSPAADAKLPTDVNIQGLRIDDKFVYTHSSDELISAVNDHRGQQVTVLTTGKCELDACQEMSQEFSVYIRREDETPEGQGALGIQMAPVVVPKFYPWPEMPVRGALYGVSQTLMLSKLIFEGLASLVTDATRGKVPADVAGPVGIFSQANEAGVFSQGAFPLLYFAGIISINLAIMNLLPIPALDGGRALFLILEKIIGRKNVQRFENYANTAGFAVLLVLIVIITLKDVIAVVIK